MTIVYTTIFGASDSLKPAPAEADRCVCFTDTSHAHTRGWEIVRQRVRDPRREAWQMRCLAHELFPAYDRVVWIDASFRLFNLAQLLMDTGAAPIAALRHHERKTCYREGLRLVRNGQADPVAINQQLEAYRVAGFAPDHLSISCVLARDRSQAVQAFNETWEQQIQRWPGDNTQVSLDYSAWVNGLTIAPLAGTRHQNPYAQHDHLDHRARRKPYILRSAVPA